jgi:CoA:oxalate CoA-transferase
MSVLKSTEVLNWNQLMQHEGFKVLDMVQEVRRSSGATMKTTRCPIRVDGQLFTSSQGSPRVGEDNARIIKELTH